MAAEPLAHPLQQALRAAIAGVDESALRRSEQQFGVTVAFETAGEAVVVRVDVRKDDAAQLFEWHTKRVQLRHQRTVRLRGVPAGVDQGVAVITLHKIGQYVAERVVGDRNLQLMNAGDDRVIGSHCHHASASMHERSSQPRALTPRPAYTVATE